VISGPKTRAEAKGWRYERPPYTDVYHAWMCAWSTSDHGRAYQCSRDPGHGPEGLWCKQHAKMAEEEEGRDG